MDASVVNKHKFKQIGKIWLHIVNGGKLGATFCNLRGGGKAFRFYSI